MVLAPLDVEILAAISQLAIRGYPPTYRDVSRSTGVAVSAIHRRVRVLREGGLVHAEDAIARSLTVTAAGLDELSSHGARA